MHLKAVEKIANFSIENEWSADSLVNLFVQASLDYSVYNDMDSACINAFEKIDIMNLLWLTNTYYSEEIICKKMLEFRHNLGVI